MKFLRSVSAVFLSLLLIHPSFAASAPKESPVYPFIEIVYELDTHPLKDRRLQDRSSPEDLNGYFLRSSPGLLRPKLFQAMGSPVSAPAKETILIGYRVLNFTQHNARNYQTLKMLEKASLQINTGEDPTQPLSIRRLGFFGLLRPEIPVIVKRKNQNDVEIEAGGKTVPIKSGETKEIFLSQQSRTPEEWIQLFRDTMKKLGADETSLDLESLRQNLSAFSSEEDGPIILYARISAIHHGSVNFADIDVLNEWQIAKDKLLKGPYDEAKTALEKVLAAVPEQREARQMYDQLLSLEAEGKTPSSLRGKLAFPDGMPTEKLKDFWKKYNEGTAAIARENASENSAIATAQVKDGAFTIFVPSGTYNLIVTVPGFSIYRQKITVKGSVDVHVPLEKSS